MEDLIMLKDYAKENGFSMYTMKQWIENGLKHIGTRPYRTKVKWINEYIEENAIQKQSCTKKFKKQRIARQVCSNKIELADFV